MIELGAGDAVLFRYDVKHGGAAYTHKHMRLHEYWEPEGAGTIEFRVALRYAGDTGGNQLHAVETSASWNKMSAAYNKPWHGLCLVQCSPSLRMLQTQQS